MTREKKNIVLVILLLVGVFTFMSFFNRSSYVFAISNTGEKPIEDSLPTTEVNYKYSLSGNYMIQPVVNWGVYREKVKVKGIYLTGNSISYKPRFERLINLMNETELNSMVIDVKDDKGILTYKSNSKIAKQVGANKVVKVKNFDKKMSIIRDNDIYPIARIVTFKDRLAGSKRPDLTIKSKNGSVWRDNKGNAWLNPYNKDAWEYAIQLAEEAALKGFKEIQFDYVRFPTDGNRALIDYGQAAKTKTKEEAISEFLAYAKKRLEPKGVYVSADIFGLVTTVKGDMDIGQQLEKLATSTDVLCPMVYPSHYALGSYGVAYPDSNPYKIVYTSMSRAKKRIDDNVDAKNKAILRPWLQDFSATWLKKSYGPHYTTYGPKQIRAQIQATYDAGVEEWIFWSASNRYTESAFLKEEEKDSGE